MKSLFSILVFTLLMNCTTQKKSNYSKIEYQAGACFGLCPIFKMTINPDHSVVVDAERFTFQKGNTKSDFNKPKEGIYKTQLSDETYKILENKLDSLNINTLKEKYGDKNITDLPTSHLKITYKEGGSKSIEDYGKSGTPELRTFYQFIESLIQSQNWTKTE